jgi:glycopeptide antibiotics resistance protein
MLVVYNLLADVAIWVPPAFLITVAGRPAGQAFALSMALAAGLELAQLFVYSRVTDATDLVTAMAGGSIGVWLARRWRPAAAGGHRPLRVGGFPWGLLTLAVVWAGVLAAVFWYPFEIELDRAVLRERAGLLLRAPFTAYYYGTEFRAVTEVIHKIAFFAPLGVLLGLARARLLTRDARTVFAVLAGMAIGAVAAGIELGQVAMPRKVVSSTDIGLARLGGCAALWLTGRVAAADRRGRSQRPAAGPDRSSRPAGAPPRSSGSKGSVGSGRRRRRSASPR